MGSNSDNELQDLCNLLQTITSSSIEETYMKHDLIEELINIAEESLSEGNFSEQGGKLLSEVTSVGSLTASLIDAIYKHLDKKCNHLIIKLYEKGYDILIKHNEIISVGSFEYETNAEFLKYILQRKILNIPFQESLLPSKCIIHRLIKREIERQNSPDSPVQDLLSPLRQFLPVISESLMYGGYIIVKVQDCRNDYCKTTQMQEKIRFILLLTQSHLDEFQYQFHKKLFPAQYQCRDPPPIAAIIKHVDYYEDEMNMKRKTMIDLINNDESHDFYKDIIAPNEEDIVDSCFSSSSDILSKNFQKSPDCFCKMAYYLAKRNSESDFPKQCLSVLQGDLTYGFYEQGNKSSMMHVFHYVLPEAKEEKDSLFNARKGVMYVNVKKRTSVLNQDYTNLKWIDNAVEFSSKHDSSYLKWIDNAVEFLSKHEHGSLKRKIDENPSDEPCDRKLRRTSSEQALSYDSSYLKWIDNTVEFLSKPEDGSLKRKINEKPSDEPCDTKLRKTTSEQALSYDYSYFPWIDNSVEFLSKHVSKKLMIESENELSSQPGTAACNESENQFSSLSEESRKLMMDLEIDLSSRPDTAACNESKNQFSSLSEMAAGNKSENQFSSLSEMAAYNDSENEFSSLFEKTRNSVVSESGNKFSSIYKELKHWLAGMLGNQSLSDVSKTLLASEWNSEFSFISGVLEILQTDEWTSEHLFLSDVLKFIAECESEKGFSSLPDALKTLMSEMSESDNECSSLLSEEIERYTFEFSNVLENVLDSEIIYVSKTIGKHFSVASSKAWKQCSSRKYNLVGDRKQLDNLIHLTYHDILNKSVGPVTVHSLKNGNPCWKIHINSEKKRSMETRRLPFPLTEPSSYLSLNLTARKTQPKLKTEMDDFLVSTQKKMHMFPPGQICINTINRFLDLVKDQEGFRMEQFEEFLFPRNKEDLEKRLKLWDELKDKEDGKIMLESLKSSYQFESFEEIRNMQSYRKLLEQIQNEEKTKYTETILKLNQIRDKEEGENMQTYEKGGDLFKDEEECDRTEFKENEEKLERINETREWFEARERAMPFYLIGKKSLESGEDHMQEDISAEENRRKEYNTNPIEINYGKCFPKFSKWNSKEDERVKALFTFQDDSDIDDSSEQDSTEMEVNEYLKHLNTPDIVDLSEQDSAEMEVIEYVNYLDDSDIEDLSEQDSTEMEVNEYLKHLNKGVLYQ